MADQQTIIDKLIDYIDKAILKNSVSNRDVAAVLAFLNERMKELSVIDLEQLAKTFIRKDQPDATEHLLKMLGGLEVGEAVDSMTAGKGTIIDSNGRMQADILELRKALIVFEIIYNRLNAVEGDTSFTDFGTIEKVELIAPGTYRLWLRKRWNTDFTALQEHDVLYGIVNTLLEAGEYYTSWFRVLAKNVTENSITVVLYLDEEVPGGRNFPPTEGMNITRHGNTDTPVDGTHNDRQDAWKISSREGALRFFQNVYKPILEEYNYALSVGKFPNISAIEKLPISAHDTGVYAKIGVFEKLYQVDYNGDVMANEVMRGDWSAEVAASDSPYRRVVHSVETPNGSLTNLMEIHTVYHLGSKWHCLIDKTLEEPGWNVPGWQWKEGSGGYEMQFDSSNGFQFFFGNVNTTVTALLFFGDIEITEKVMALPGSDVQWTRDTGNIPDDNAWQPVYEDGQKNKIKLSREDMGVNWLQNRKATFICKIFIPIGGVHQEVKRELPINI